MKESCAGCTLYFNLIKASSCVAAFTDPISLLIIKYLGMAGTPATTPIDIENDKWEGRETWSSDPEIDLTCRNYVKQHRGCPHDDEDAYLVRELKFFKEHDVILRNLAGKRVASLRSSVEVKVSNIYRWIAIGFGSADNWNIMHTTTGLTLNRADTSPIKSGDYIVSGKTSQRTLERFVHISLILNQLKVTLWIFTPCEPQFLCVRSRNQIRLRTIS